MEHLAQAVDPFVFRLSIFVLAVFVGGVHRQRHAAIIGRLPPVQSVGRQPGGQDAIAKEFAGALGGRP